VTFLPETELSTWIGESKCPRGFNERGATDDFSNGGENKAGFMHRFWEAAPLLSCTCEIN
jgi:hypothetical protein